MLGLLKLGLGLTVYYGIGKWGNNATIGWT